MHKTIFSIKTYKTLGSNGFPLEFFKHFWEVIKVDVVRAARDFFRTGKMLQRLNRIFIALSPKIKDPTTLTNFRPINLCNITYKIFSKIQVNRLKPLLEKFIDKP